MFVCAAHPITPPFCVVAAQVSLRVDDVRVVLLWRGLCRGGRCRVRMGRESRVRMGRDKKGTELGWGERGRVGS